MPKVGETYLFMSVTHYWTGRLVEERAFEFIISEASWIPHTGRLYQCIRDGVVSLCEPVGDENIGIPRCAWIPWKHPLPRTQVPPLEGHR